MNLDQIQMLITLALVAVIWFAVGTMAKEIRDDMQATRARWRKIGDEQKPRRIQRRAVDQALRNSLRAERSNL